MFGKILIVQHFLQKQPNNKQIHWKDSPPVKWLGVMLSPKSQQQRITGSSVLRYIRWTISFFQSKDSVLF